MSVDSLESKMVASMAFDLVVEKAGLKVCYSAVCSAEMMAGYSAASMADWMGLCLEYSTVKMMVRQSD